MTTELSGEDASIQAATAKILSLGPSAWGEDAPAPKPRENRPDRDPIEKETSTDLAESEQEQAQERAEAKPDEKAPDEAAADFIEIPGEEGQEAEKVPLADAVEAIKQMRALNGDVASAVNKAEAEYQEKVDRGLSEMIGIYQNMRQHAEAVLMSLPLPQPPDRSLIRTDNEVYELLLNDYEQRVALYQNAQQRYSEAKAEEDRIQSAKDALREKREDERLARYLPEWKNEKTRVELQQSMTDFMVKAYGLEPDVLDKVKFDHRLVRAMHELMNLKSQATKAPDVRKEVQEKAPKITKAAPSQQRAPDGRFASDAAKQLKESGSEEAAARLFLSDPRFKSLFA